MKFSKETNIKLNNLSVCDNYHMAIALAADWLVISFAVFLSVFSFYFYPLTLLLIGSRQRALATVLHEAVHDRAANHKILNNLLGTLFSGYWIFQCFGAYRKSHVAMHHGSLGDLNNDPDFQFYVTQGLYQGLNRKQFFFSYVLSPILLFKVVPYLSYLVTNRLASFKHFRKELFWFSLFWGFVFAVLATFHLFPYFLLYWIIPYLTTFIMIGHFIEISEHCPLLGHYTEQVKMSRNRFSHFIEAFFLSIHNEHLHLTHHLRPGIPFWRLKEAHKLMLENSVYRQVNEQFGGVFLSKDRKKSALIPGLIQGKIALPTKLKDIPNKGDFYEFER